MDLIFSKKIIFLVLAICGILIWNIGSDSKPQGKKTEEVLLKSNLVKTQESQKKSDGVSAISPLVHKEYLKQKQKLQDEKFFHEKILQSRKEYLVNQHKQRDTYLRYRTKYTQLSSQQIKGKFDSFKRKKEKMYQQKFEQFTMPKRSERYVQTQKRVESESMRLKALKKIQDKQYLNQKYKGE